MKILEFKKRNVYHIGFINPCAVNEKTIQFHRRETEENLLKFLREQWCKEEILFPYDFK